MRELLLEIWASIRRNKLRTFLTGFSVAWGIFMLVILLGSGNGLKNGTLSNFGSMAVNSVIINGGWTSQPYKGYDKWRRINITNRDLEILRTEFPEVDKVSARVQGPGQYNLSHGPDPENTGRGSPSPMLLYAGSASVPATGSYRCSDGW